MLRTGQAVGAPPPSQKHDIQFRHSMSHLASSAVIHSMEFGSLDEGEDGEYNGDGLLKISKIFLTQDGFVYKAAFDCVYKANILQKHQPKA